MESGDVNSRDGCSHGYIACDFSSREKDFFTSLLECITKMTFFKIELISKTKDERERMGQAPGNQCVQIDS